MKMRKIAKDKTGKVLQEGDIIQLEDGMAVIEAIDQPHRDRFPTLITSRVWLDWKGALKKADASNLIIDDYKHCAVIDGSKLRDDVQYFKDLKLISDRIREKLAYSQSQS